MSTSIKYICMVLYDLPTTLKSSARAYRIFRKVLIKNGYYQLQESVYCKKFNEKSQAKNSIKNLKNFAPLHGNIRAIIFTNNVFEQMEIILGETKFEEKVLSNKSRILEL